MDKLLLVLIPLIVVTGCAQRDPMFACKPPAISITYYGHDNCFWPEPPQRPGGPS